MARKCLFSQVPVFGEPTGNRTQDLRIKSPVLYQLSYRLYRDCIYFKIGGLHPYRKVSSPRAGPSLSRYRHRSARCYCPLIRSLRLAYRFR